MSTEDAQDVVLLAAEIFTSLVCTEEEGEGEFYQAYPEKKAEQLADRSFMYATAFVERKREFEIDNNLI